MKEICRLVAVIILIMPFYSAYSGEHGVTVDIYGALSDIMHNHDISAKVDLSDFGKTKHFYALGAAENLKGEIQIIDGHSWNSEVVNGKLVIDSSFSKQATLLVCATVKDWQTVEVPAGMENYEQLEGFIEQAAAKNDLDTTKPFPFLIEGNASVIDWHVIDWIKGDTVHTHAKHKSSGLTGILENKDVVVLGFYSKHHHAVFTHHSTNMHLHFRTVDGQMAGHVDGITPGRAMILKLPSSS